MSEHTDHVDDPAVPGTPVPAQHDRLAGGDELLRAELLALRQSCREVLEATDADR